MSAANMPDRPVDTVTGAARERARQIRSLREQGESLDEIAALYGVSRERVRQILRAHGGPDRQQVAQARQLRAAQRSESPEPGDHPQPDGWLEERLAVRRPHRPPGRRNARRSRRWTAEACWAVLRDVTWELGTIPTIAAYDRYAADRAAPSCRRRRPCAIASAAGTRSPPGSQASAPPCNTQRPTPTAHRPACSRVGCREIRAARSRRRRDGPCATRGQPSSRGRVASMTAGSSLAASTPRVLRPSRRIPVREVAAEPADQTKLPRL